MLGDVLHLPASFARLLVMVGFLLFLLLNCLLEFLVNQLLQYAPPYVLFLPDSMVVDKLRQVYLLVLLLLLLPLLLQAHRRPWLGGRCLRLLFV